MKIDITQNGRVLRTIAHEGQTYVEAPTSGEYKLRVHNNSYRRRLAIISVDGINVVNGNDASYEGGGYVLEAWQTVDIPGFRRDDGTVAAFKFTEQGGSYAAKMGKGTKNVGVIGLAVFDEKVIPKVIPPPVVIHEHHHHHQGGWVGMMFDTSYNTNDTFGSREPVTSSTTNTVGLDGLTDPHNDVGTGYGEEGEGPVVMAGAGGASAAGDSFEYQDEDAGPPNLEQRLAAYKEAKANVRGAIKRRRRVRQDAAPAKDVGTGYGREVRFATMETTFTRAGTTPNLLVTLRYATRARLESWGVPIEKHNVGPMAANPFPAAPGVPAPPGWRG